MIAFLPNLRRGALRFAYIYKYHLYDSIILSIPFHTIVDLCKWTVNDLFNKSQ